MIMMLVIIAMCVIIPFIYMTAALKWWVLFAMLSISLFIAIPAPLRLQAFKKVLAIPQLVFKMLKNILHLDRKNTDFIHTEHNA
jgi:hypothetical protein